MGGTNRKRVREIYFYKTESGEFKIDLVDGQNNLVKEPLYYSNRSDINNFIETLQENKNTKFEVSRLGMKIYNKKPEQRVLTQTSESVFDTYINNLTDLQENHEYGDKVAKLLRSVADIVEPAVGTPEEIDPITITPKNPVSPEISVPFLNNIEETLQTTISEDATFWFQDQKFQVTKDGYEYETPEPMLPKTSHNILGTLEYISNLLGVNAERNTEIGKNSIRFVNEGEVYVIRHIYTGDHNTLGHDSTI